MLAAIEDEYERVVRVMQHNAFSAPEARAHADKSVAPLRAMLDQLDGIDLTPSEWHTMQWFIGWDANDSIASIFAKLSAHSKDGES